LFTASDDQAINKPDRPASQPLNHQTNKYQPETTTKPASQRNFKHVIDHGGAVKKKAVVA
jgi:hypothetical protein